MPQRPNFVSLDRWCLVRGRRRCTSHRPGVAVAPKRISVPGARSTTHPQAMSCLFTPKSAAAFPPGVLVTFLVLYFSFAVVTAGSNISSGMVVPSMLMGAVVGRLFGQLPSPPTRPVALICFCLHFRCPCLRGSISIPCPAEYLPLLHPNVSMLGPIPDRNRTPTPFRIVGLAFLSLLNTFGLETNWLDPGVFAYLGVLPRAICESDDIVNPTSANECWAMALLG